MVTKMDISVGEYKSGKYIITGVIITLFMIYFYSVSFIKVSVTLAIISLVGICSGISFIFYGAYSLGFESGMTILSNKKDNSQVEKEIKPVIGKRFPSYFYLDGVLIPIIYGSSNYDKTKGDGKTK